MDAKKPTWPLGYTVPAGPRELGMSYGVLRRAVRKGEVHVEPFAGLDRITPRELDRVRRLFAPPSRKISQ